MKVLECKLTAIHFKDEVNYAQTFEMEITNITDEFQTSTICVQPPLYAEPFRYFEIEINELLPGKSMKLPLTYTFLHGGRYVFYFWEKNKQLSTLDRAQFFISGPGYYSGDTHNHSFYSDGTSTLEENRQSMLEKGHSFLYSTDHNTLEHRTEIEAFQQTSEAEKFLHIAGWEYTTANGHALAYGIDYIYDPTVMTEKGNLQQWQKFVDDMKEDDGIVFLAHPYEAPKYEFGESLLMNIKNITGIEVWNGFNHHALTYQNRRAFEMWDLLNMKGDSKYVGNAVSDAHSKEKQGNPFIKGYFSELNRENVHQLLKNGQFFGSNGPEINFTIDEMSIGETVRLKESSEHKKFNLAVFDPAGLIESIVVYKGVIEQYSNTPNKRKKAIKVLEFFPTGEAEKRYFEKEFFCEVNIGEFYRVEVISSFGIVAYSKEKLEQDKGFAYTNPIWIE